MEWFFNDVVYKDAIVQLASMPYKGKEERKRTWHP
jgi:hypothetical protein